MQTLDEAIFKCVFFWIEKSFSQAKNQNNGDKTKQGDVVNMLLNLVSDEANKSVTEYKITLFQKKLTELLLAQKNNYERSLSVDYDACELLSEACEFAGIDQRCLPVKSSTCINTNNDAFGKHQYGGANLKL